MTFVTQEIKSVLTSIGLKFAPFMPIGQLIDDIDLLEVIYETPLHTSFGGDRTLIELTKKEEDLLKSDYAFYFLNEGNDVINIYHAESIELFYKN